jgi:membrane-associated phospholipid phosphatase
VTLLLWHQASLAFFASICVILALRRPWTRQSARALAGAAAGLGSVAFAAAVAQPRFFADWIWPPIVLLVAYWTSGLLFVRPSPAQEHALMRFDEWLRIRDVARRTPRAVAELLEIAYVGVYPLIPIALVLRRTFAPDLSIDRFWTTILVTDFLCFGVLPWVQTRPPRALEQGEPWASAVRPLNLRLLGRTSIQANTFPSGHTAEALAAALLSMSAPAPVALVMFAAAVAVAGGAVLGRYHFAADAVTGWLVAVVVWLVAGA